MSNLEHRIIADGRYKLIRKFARGAHAELWEAQQAGFEGFQRLVAMKIVRITPEIPELSRESLLREGRLAAILNHPNIVQIYDVGEEKDLVYIAMEYVRGLDLRRCLRRHLERHQAPLPWPLVARLGALIARGLSHAHEQTDNTGTPLRIVHRDIKPSNAILSREGIVKLIDFGIAKSFTLSSGRSLDFKGTIAYVSPEQILGKEVDHRSDLFSFGILLYELLLGRRPFGKKGAPFGEIMQSILQTLVEPPRQLLPSLPSLLDELIFGLLEKDPERRPNSAREIYTTLEAVLREEQHYIQQENLADFCAGLLQDPTEQTDAQYPSSVELDYVGSTSISQTPLPPHLHEQEQEQVDYYKATTHLPGLRIEDFLPPKNEEINQKERDINTSPNDSEQQTFPRTQPTSEEDLGDQTSLSTGLLAPESWNEPSVRRETPYPQHESHAQTTHVPISPRDDDEITAAGQDDGDQTSLSHDLPPTISSPSQSALPALTATLTDEMTTLPKQTPSPSPGFQGYQASPNHVPAFAGYAEQTNPNLVQQAEQTNPSSSTHPDFTTPSNAEITDPEAIVMGSLDSRERTSRFFIPPTSPKPPPTQPIQTPVLLGQTIPDPKPLWDPNAAPSHPTEKKAKNALPSSTPTQTSPFTKMPATFSPPASPTPTLSPVHSETTQIASSSFLATPGFWIFVIALSLVAGGLLALFFRYR